jgi:hypothetical protein
MSTKKHKRKIVKHTKKNPISKNQVSKSPAKHASLINTYPRASMGMGILFIVTGFFLLLIGMNSDTRFGLAMLSISVGAVIMFYANIAFPKKETKSIR